MAKAIDVAKYILEQRDAHGHETTTFALQKLLYYCQSWMLVANDRPLFDEPIVAWRHGPVVRAVYPYCKGRRLIFPREIPDGNSDRLNVVERSLIDRVVSQFDRPDDKRLSDNLEKMSHEETPWAETQQGNIIPRERMLSFYSQVQANPKIDHAAPIPDLYGVSQRTFISNEDADWLDRFLQD